MDTNNQTHDVNALLQKALKRSAKPDAELLVKLKQELAKKERDILNKPKTKRPIRRLAIAIAATLALTTTVFATGMHLGSFDRLRDIVGDQRAGVLQPLEIISTPEEQSLPDTQYTGYDTVNEYLPETQIPDNNLEELGIRAELVAVGVFDNVVDIYVMLEDLTGGRLDDYFQVGHMVAPANDDGIGVLSLTPEIINRSDDGIVTIRSREIFTHSVAGMELRYALTGINYNLTCPGQRPPFRDLSIDFAALTPQPSILFMPDGSPSRSGGGGWSNELFDEFEEKMVNEGFAVLQPHLHDIEIDLDGETAIISSMGIIENRLHVQIYNPTPDAIGTLAFMQYNYYNGDSRTISFGFNKDAQGNLVRGEVGSYGFEVVQYREFIFMDVDFDMLTGYRMRGRSHAPSFDRLDLNWSVTFDVPVNDTQIVAGGLNVQYDTVTVTEVRVTPFLIQVVLDREVTGLNAPEITIHTINGTVSAAGMSFSGFGMGNFFYDIGPLDLDTIISVEIGGETIVF